MGPWSLHKKQIYYGIPVISYPGIPQGRDFGKKGLGCFLVDRSFKDARLNFIVTSSVVFKGWKFGLTKSDIPETITELEDLISGIADELIEEGIKEGIKEDIEKDIDKDVDKGIDFDNESSAIDGYVVQWIIKGRGKIHDTLMEQKEEASHEITQELRRMYQGAEPFLWTDSVDIKTRKVLPDRIEYKNNPFFQELNNVVKECQKAMHERVLFRNWAKYGMKRRLKILRLSILFEKYGLYKKLVSFILKSYWKRYWI